MKQEPLVWKHFDQLVLHDLENAKNAKQKRQIIKCALGLEKRDWNNKGTLKSALTNENRLVIFRGKDRNIIGCICQLLQLCQKTRIHKSEHIRKRLSKLTVFSPYISPLNIGA